MSATAATTDHRSVYSKLSTSPDARPSPPILSRGGAVGRGELEILERPWQRKADTFRWTHQWCVYAGETICESLHEWFASPCST
jgi:hypothetical protein